MSTGKLFNQVIQKVQTRGPKATFTHEDVSLMLRDSMAKHCLSINQERESLIQQLELVEEVLNPLQKEVENAKEAGHIKSVRAGFSFVTIIILQYIASQYGTYVAFSWDIIEPITACVTLSDACLGYLFWCYSGRPWDLDSLRSFYYHKELNKNLRKHNINEEEYKQLVASKKQILDKLMETQKEE